MPTLRHHKTVVAASSCDMQNNLVQNVYSKNNHFTVQSNATYINFARAFINQAKVTVQHWIKVDLIKLQIHQVMSFTCRNPDTEILCTLQK